MTISTEIDYDDIDRRAKAISDWTPKHIQSRVAFKKWYALQEWRLSDPRESCEPIDNYTEKD